MSKSTWENINISNNYCSLSYFKYVEMRCIRLSLHCSLTSQSSSDWTSSSFHYLNLGPEKEKKKDCDTVFDELFLTTDHQIYNITRLCLHKLSALFRTTSCPASKISELTVHLEPQWWSKSSSLIIWKKNDKGPVHRFMSTCESPQADRVSVPQFDWFQVGSDKNKDEAIYLHGNVKLYFSTFAFSFTVIIPGNYLFKMCALDHK